nr:MarR family transcriptional reg-ulator [uncultured bacterium]
MEQTTGASRAQAQAELGRQLGTRFSTAVVLFHSAAAERMGLNVTDWKCASIVRAIGPCNPGRISEETGMSTAATAQVLGRLERAGLVVREADPDDRRRTIVRPVFDPAREQAAAELFVGLIDRMNDLMARFDEGELAAIGTFLTGAADVLTTEAAQLRASAPRRSRT